MKYQNMKNRRLKLLNLVKTGSFQSIATKDYVATGLILPRDAKDSLLKLLDSKFHGDYYVVWKDYLGGDACYRPLESKMTPSYLMTHPDVKVRIHMVDCCCNSLGFIEPELFYGFVPDWEDRL